MTLFKVIESIDESGWRRRGCIRGHEVAAGVEVETTCMFLQVSFYVRGSVQVTR